jgi:hypothetical protein
VASTVVVRAGAAAGAEAEGVAVADAAGAVSQKIAEP